MATDTRRTTGIKGEEEAARFLSRCGYAILDKNVRTRVGEIDLFQCGQRECRSLAGAGLRLAQQIATGQQVRDAGGLNRRRRFIAQGLQGFQQRG